MARAFAKKFYKSNAWKKARRAYIAEVCGLCERCGRPCGTSGIVHHREHLNEININDPDVTLNKTKLEYLCIFCHNAEHMGAKVLAEGLIFGIDGDLLPPGVMRQKHAKKLRVEYLKKTHMENRSPCSGARVRAMKRQRPRRENRLENSTSSGVFFDGDKNMTATNNEFMKLNIEQKELRRTKTALKRLFAKLEPDRLKAADSMLDNAAFLIVTLARLREAMNERGVVEIYQHGENQMGRKISAEAQLYNQLIKNYSTLMKQVLDLLPKADAAGVKDGFEDFVYKR